MAGEIAAGGVGGLAGTVGGGGRRLRPEPWLARSLPVASVDLLAPLVVALQRPLSLRLEQPPPNGRLSTAVALRLVVAFFLESLALHLLRGLALPALSDRFRAGAGRWQAARH